MAGPWKTLHKNPLHVQIDSHAYSNRWRQVHPGEKSLVALFGLTAALLSKTPLMPLVITTFMAGLTVVGAAIPWREYLRLAAFPMFILTWSCLSLALSFSGADLPMVSIPALHVTISLNKQGIDQAQLAFTRSLAATSSLLFLALTTPMTEIMNLLRSLALPGLFLDMMTIAYRQIFIFLEIAAQIRAAQQARLGYASTRLALKSLASLSGTILFSSLIRARQNYQGLLARGYDTHLHFLSPRHSWSSRNLFAATAVGLTLIILALVITP